jgi:hypothetical protein
MRMKLREQKLDVNPTNVLAEPRAHAGSSHLAVPYDFILFLIGQRDAASMRMPTSLAPER